MILYLLKILSLILPLLLSGITLIVFLKLDILHSLNCPLDHFATFQKKRLFGDNKTYRGVLVHGVGIMAVSWLLHYFSSSLYTHTLFNQSPWFVSLLYFSGYIGGELLNSFIKRRIDIPPGKTVTSSFRYLQEFFDTADGILVVGILLVLFAHVAYTDAFFAIGLGIFIHLLTDRLMYRLHLKKKSKK